MKRIVVGLIVIVAVVTTACSQYTCATYAKNTQQVKKHQGNL